MHSPKLKTSSQRYAIIAIILVVLWVLSGVVWRGVTDDVDEVAGEKATQVKQRIEILKSEAISKQRYAEIYGVTQPNRDVSIAAQTRGEVVAILAREGKPIDRGAPIVRIDMQDRKMQLAAAEASLVQRQAEFEGAKKLKAKGFESDVAYAKAKADLQNAKASIAALKLDISYTTIRAPFSGLLEKINVEKGDFAGVGVFGVEGSIARVIDINPLLAVGETAQADRPFVNMNKPVIVHFSDGREVEGKITYLAKAATENSRSFPFEVSLPNDDISIASGLSATIRLPLDEKLAHLVPSSLLSLNDAGDLQVKTLDAENRVVSQGIAIMEESNEGLWLSGLPQNVTFITKGAAFLQDGQTIDESTIDLASQNEPTD